MKTRFYSLLLSIIMLISSGLTIAPTAQANNTENEVLFKETFDDNSFESKLEKLRPSAESSSKGVTVATENGELKLTTQNNTTGGQRPVRYTFDNLINSDSDGFEISFKFKLDTILKRESAFVFTKTGNMTLEPYAESDDNIFALFIGGTDTAAGDNTTMVTGTGIMRAIVGGTFDGTSSSKQILRVNGGNDALFSTAVTSDKYVTVDAKIDYTKNIATVSTTVEGSETETKKIALPDNISDSIGAVTITNGMKASTGDTNYSMSVDDLIIANYTTADLSILNKECENNTLLYTVDVKNGIKGSVIFAAYNEDGTLEAIDVKEIAENSIVGTLPVKAEKKGTTKIMIWNKLDGMAPATQAISDTWTTETTTIKLNYNTYPLVVGNSTNDGSTVKLTADISNDQYNENQIEWTCDNDDVEISTLGASATVKGNKTGYATVKAELPNGQNSECLITVIDNISRSTVLDLRLNTDKLNLAVGDTPTLHAFIAPDDYFGNGYINKDVTWSTSNDKVATVDQNGNVTALSIGTVSITATVDTDKTAVCNITVSENNDTTETELPTFDTSAMTVGEKRYIGEGNWVSSNRFIADIEDGYLTAYANTDKIQLNDGKVVYDNGMVAYQKGTVDIMFTDINGGRTVSYPIEISDAPITVQSVSIDKETVSIPLNQEFELNAVANPAPLLNQNIEWSSSDESIVKVESDGFTVDGAAKAKVTAIGVGNAQITAELDGKNAVCNVTVTPNTVKVNSVNLDENKIIDVDEVYKIEPTISEENATDKELIWISTDRTIATVNNEGIIKGYNTGNATIYAIAKDSLSEQQLVTVEKLSDTALRSITDDNKTALDEILTDSVYGKCTVTVENPSNYLRNVNVPNEAVTFESVQLNWTRASLIDATDFECYKIYCNDVLIDTTDKLSYTAKNLVANTTYTFKIAAMANNEVQVEKNVEVKTKPEPTEIIDITQEPYNAKGDGLHTDTYAIQKAIDDCTDGGMVYVPKGFYYSGALFLKSNITFKVDGVIIGSVRPNDYPDIVTRWEGWRKIYQTVESGWENYTDSVPACDTNRYANSSLINAGVYFEGEAGKSSPYNVSNISVIGTGEINANGFTLAYYEGPNTNETSIGTMSPTVKTLIDDPTTRGRTVTLHNAQNVYFEGITTSFSPGWCVHPIYCDSVTFDGMNVITKANNTHKDGAGKSQSNQILNGDGIDPESCSRVNIIDVWFCTGDDNIAMKSGRNKEGNELDKPNSYIRVTDTVAQDCKGGYCIGSEMAAGAHDVMFQNISTKGYLNLPGLWIKAPKARGGIIEDIIFRDCDINGASRAVSFELAYDDGNGFTNVNPASDIPYVRNILLDNVYGTNRNGLYLAGDSARKITGIKLRGINLTGGKNTVKNCEYEEID